MNNSSQLDPEEILFILNLSFKIISIDSIKVMPLSVTIPIIISFLISSIIIYFIFTLLLIVIIWIVIEKKYRIYEKKVTDTFKLVIYISGYIQG